MTTLAENRYGKSRVRLAKLKRHGGQHDFREWTVEILLEGDFESCFVSGDNSKILPTDTMKNTVYSLARKSSSECIEDFGKELAAFFLTATRKSLPRTSRSPKKDGSLSALRENSILPRSSNRAQSYKPPTLPPREAGRRRFAPGSIISSS